ncbi:MAG: type III pantothenate kinase, partial [Calditrichaeota bacterium]|nr:type III pantothenate kinase [Calditrichota bacterium]
MQFSKQSNALVVAVDVGNTHVEIGLYKGKDFVGSWRIATGVHRTEDELMTFIEYFLGQKGYKGNDVE